MSTVRIYADFHNADPEGRLRLNCVGTIEDLSRYQVELRDGEKLVLLLLYAGIKGTQKKDIKKAHEYWDDFLSRREHEKAE